MNAQHAAQVGRAVSSTARSDREAIAGVLRPPMTVRLRVRSPLPLMRSSRARSLRLQSARRSAESLRIGASSRFGGPDSSGSCENRLGSFSFSVAFDPPDALRRGCAPRRTRSVDSFGVETYNGLFVCAFDRHCC